MRIMYIEEIDRNIKRSLICETDSVKLEEIGHTVFVKDCGGLVIDKVSTDGQHYLVID